MLFEGKKFWVAHRVPMRSTFVQQIKENGGQLVPLEKMADLLIWDHLRWKDAPPGTISYTFIEQSVKNGELEDPEAHRCGPPLGAQRETGSARPAKGTREPYTLEDDRVCYKWGIEAERAGVQVKGNDLWKQLGALVGTASCWDKCILTDGDLEFPTPVAVVARSLGQETERQTASRLGGRGHRVAGREGRGARCHAAKAESP
jgi:hypothetical protein